MKKLLCISLLCILLTGCGSKTKEKESGTSSSPELIEKAEEDVYAVMSKIMVEYELSSLDENPMSTPLTVTCKEEGCTYKDGTKIELEAVPKAGTFTLKEGKEMLFEATSDIVMGDYSCSIQSNNIVKCKEK